MPHLQHLLARMEQPLHAVRPNLDAISEFGICGGFLYCPWSLRTESFSPRGWLRRGYDSTTTGERPDIVYLSPTKGRFSALAGRHNTDASNRIHFFYSGEPSAQSFTFLSRFRINAALTGPIVRTGTTTADGTTIPVWRNSGTWDMRVNGTDYTNAGTFSTDTWYDLDIISSSASCVLQVDGVDVISGSAASAGTIQPLVGFGGVTGGGGVSTGQLDIEYMLISNRVLSPGQRLSLRLNPHQLFEPDPIHVYWTSAGGSSALSGSGSTVGTLNTVAFVAVNLSSTGAAIGTLEGSTGATFTTADLSSAGASTVTGAGAARVTAELDTDGAAVGTLASASFGSANLSSAGAAVGTFDITDAGAYATTRLDSTGAATANAVGIVTQASGLSGTGAAANTAATATVMAAVLTSDGAAAGALAGEAISGYEETTLSTAGASTTTLVGALTIAAALSSAGASTARLRGSTAETADNAYLTWGAHARRLKQVLDTDDDELVELVALSLPHIMKGHKRWQARRRTAGTA